MLGTLLAVGGSIAGGIAGANAASKQRRMLEQQKQKNQAWYDKNYYSDPTQRADAQAVLTRMRDIMQSRTKRAAGTAAVTGGTEESVAAEKEAQNNALAQTVSGIAASNENRKDNVEQQYMQKDAAITDAQMQQQSNIGQNIAGAVSGLGQIAGGIESSLAGVKDAEVTDANKIKDKEINL